MIRPIKNLFCVIAHRVPNTDDDAGILYYGMSRADDISKIHTPMRSDGYRAYAMALNRIEIVTMLITENRAVASKQLSELLGNYYDRNGAYPLGNWQKKRMEDKRVKCVETGVIYHTQSDAARAIGTARSTMSNHIKGRDGYGSIYGMTFVMVKDLHADG